MNAVVDSWRFRIGEIVRVLNDNLSPNEQEQYAVILDQTENSNYKVVCRVGGVWQYWWLNLEKLLNDNPFGTTHKSVEIRLAQLGSTLRDVESFFLEHFSTRRIEEKADELVFIMSYSTRTAEDLEEADFPP